MLSRHTPTRLNPGLVMHEIPDALLQRLRPLPLLRFNSGELLQAPDAEVDHVFRIESGLVRLFALEADGREFNHGFHGAGDWVFGRIVLREGALCCDGRALGIAALRSGTAQRVTTAALECWRREDPVIGEYLFAQLMHFGAERMGRAQDQVLRSAEQRYRDLLRTQPDITRDVPLQQIASWLGITPVALSRVRRRVHGSAPK
jgi:CRP-like cAMP-binding protein